MPADFTISQAGGAGAGTLNTELLAVWGGLVVQLAASAAAGYSWEILDRPNGAVATIVSPTAQNATLTPDDLPGRWRIQLTTPAGTRVVVFEVTKTVAGVVYNFGLGVTPAHLERPSEAGGRGAARIFERFRASLLSLISALPLANELLLRDTGGAAVASSFTGGSTLDTVVTAVNTSPTERKILIGRASAGRLRFEETNSIYFDRWNGAAHEDAAGLFAITGGLLASNATGTCEFSLGPSNIALGAGAGTVTCTSSGATTLNTGGGSHTFTESAVNSKLPSYFEEFAIWEIGTGIDREYLLFTKPGSSEFSITTIAQNPAILVSLDILPSGGGSFRPGGSLTLQPQQATAGVGPALKIGGGPGQTPGTHLAGKVIVDQGARVANATAPMEFHDGDGVFLSINGETFANHSLFSHKRTNSSMRFEASVTGGGISFTAHSSVLFWAQAATGFYDVLASYYRWRDTSGTTRKRERLGSATISSATTTSVVTVATEADRVYQCVGYLTVSNDTDNEGAAYMLRAAFKRVGGTVTQIGATQTIAADLEDAGQTGLSATIDFSGADIRLRLTTDAADTVNANGWLDVHERVLA